MSDDTPGPVLVWFRNDLRLSDHAALCAAAEQGPVLPVFVLDLQASGPRAPGSASAWWLHHSLVALAQDIAERGGQLCLRRGDTVDELAAICEQAGAAAVYFSRGYAPWERSLERAVHERLAGCLAVRRFSGALIEEPDRLATRGGRPYRVFTPFWNAFRERSGAPAVRQVLRRLEWWRGRLASERVERWGLLPRHPDWAGGLRALWRPGEAGAVRRLDRFLQTGIGHSGRDRPDLNGTSRLSPHLHFGEISPARVWHRVAGAIAAGRVDQAPGWAFLRELAWREFCYHLLYHFPHTVDHSFRPRFDQMPWRADTRGLAAWQRGRTGYPMVDAGMRELWQTGWMHNRVRMIAGSFLVKHLLIDWREGERWFWDTLVDADLANNVGGWQWVAGGGADAAPYFRIFNPITQGEKFDPDGAYVRRWVPELARLPGKYLNRPWEAPRDVLHEAGVELGNTYPVPLVDHRSARARALSAFETIKGADVPEAGL